MRFPPTQGKLSPASISRLSPGGCPSAQSAHRLCFLCRYHLLKLLQKFGTVKQFDFLFHKSGALEGQPRGYCFVNFETKQVMEPLPFHGVSHTPPLLAASLSTAQNSSALRARAGSDSSLCALPCILEETLGIRRSEQLSKSPLPRLPVSGG